MDSRRVRPLLYLVLLMALVLPARIARGQEHILSPSANAGTGSLPAQARLDGYPALHQQHALSCEAAAASMATRGHVSEGEILARMPRNPNPWLGFRGNVDGSQSLADGLANYGIYAPPLAHELQGFGYQTLVFTGTAAPDLLRYSIGVLRRPVVVWVTHYLGDWPAITGHAGGRSFTLIDGEHARLAVGYDARGIYTLDPLEGPRYDPWPVFLASWSRFEHMAVVVGATLPRPAAPAIHTQRLSDRVIWSWTGVALPLANEVTLFRGGRPAWQALVAPAARPAATDVVSGTIVLTGTVLATAPLSATAPPTPVAPASGLLASLSWHSGPLAVQVQLAASVPYTLTVRSVDPLGLASPLATSPIALAATPVRPVAAPILPPPVPAGVRAAIAGPRRVRWTWPMRAGLSYRVVSYRYLGPRPADYVDVTVGHGGSFARAVSPDLTYYAQILAIDDAGISSPATPPIPAPVIATARILGPLKERFRHGGYGVWHWTASGATRFIVRGFAYSGTRAVEVRQVRTTAATYTRRLVPGLAYHVMVWAVADDGEQSAPATTPAGLIYEPAHTVRRLRVRRLPDGSQRWSWAAQPDMRYRLRLTRYAGRRGTVEASIVTAASHWISPPSPPSTTDYLRVWAVDACGDVSSPAQRQGIPGPRRDQA